MTGNDAHETEGLRAVRAGKRRIRTAALVQFGALAVATGAVFAFRDGSGPGSLPDIGAIAAAVVFVLVATAGAWWSFRVVDELEVRYSLISFTVGFYVHMALFCAWALLWGGGLLGEPQAFVIFLAAGAASLLAYTVLKVRR